MSKRRSASTNPNDGKPPNLRAPGVYAPGPRKNNRNLPIDRKTDFEIKQPRDKNDEWLKKKKIFPITHDSNQYPDKKNSPKNDILKKDEQNNGKKKHDIHNDKDFKEDNSDHKGFWLEK